MKAYGVGFVFKIKNLKRYREWARLASLNLSTGRGKPLARNGTFIFKDLDGGVIAKAGRMKMVEGNQPLPARMAVTEFDSYEKALAWYNSPGMKKIRPLRADSTESWALLVEASPQPKAPWAKRKTAKAKSKAKAKPKARRRR
ncbi:MAG: DUF1330 domain-containing protein [Rhodospirillales bacterium]|nr:DUF1330 domain-containing protein [Rhodospirillales bacterium]